MIGVFYGPLRHRHGHPWQRLKVVLRRSLYRVASVPVSIFEYTHPTARPHSTYNDLIITGLVGLRPRDDDEVEVQMHDGSWIVLKQLDSSYDHE